MSLYPKLVSLSISGCQHCVIRSIAKLPRPSPQFAAIVLHRPAHRGGDCTGTPHNVLLLPGCTRCAALQGSLLPAFGCTFLLWLLTLASRRCSGSTVLVSSVMVQKLDRIGRTVREGLAKFCVSAPTLVPLLLHRVSYAQLYIACALLRQRVRRGSHGQQAIGPASGG